MVKLPPSPRAYPIVGHIPSYLRDPLGFLTQARDLGDVVLLRFGSLHAYLLNDPAEIERVLVTESKNFIKDKFLRDIKRLLGEGLLTSETDYWKRNRRFIQPAFHRDRIAAYARGMVAATERMIAGIHSGDVRSLQQDLMTLTLEIVTKALFETDIEGVASAVGQAMDVIMDRYADWTFAVFPFLADLPTPQGVRIRKAKAQLDEIVYGLIRKGRQRGGGGPDLLSMLLAAQDEEGRRMTDLQVRDEVMTLFLAGHETTALSLTYTFLLLSRNPDAARALETELDQVLGPRAPTLEDLPKLPFLHGVLLESMRLYPPAWSIGREAISDCTVGGYHVPKGGQVWMVQWAMHRDPRYFPDPEKFDPRRWLDGLEKKLPKFAYFPFGGGPRICIGNTFAIMEAELVLATVLQKFQIKVLDQWNVPVLPTITLRPKKPVMARFQQR